MKIKELTNFAQKHSTLKPVKSLDDIALAELTINNQAYKTKQVYALLDNNTGDYEQTLIDNLSQDTYTELHLLCWYNDLNDQAYLINSNSSDDLETEELYYCTVFVKSSDISACEFIAIK